MTFVGHGIAGATVAVAVLPRGASSRAKVLTILVFAALANVPDIHLPWWGHNRYDISHSVFVNLAFVALLAIPFIVSRSLCRKVGGRIVVAGGALAWFSHFLLDSFYNHGQGIALLWPFSSARLALPIPWFETLHKLLPHIDSHAIRVFAIELVSYGMVFLLVVCVRVIIVTQTRTTNPS